MNEFEAWLEQMATKPLPGGVAAAALAAAMGAALVAKVAASAPAGAGPEAGGGRARQAVVHRAQAAGAELVRLAAADEAAYRGVLDTRHLPAGDARRRQAWHRATEIPLSVAETCRQLLAELSTMDDAGVSGLSIDFEIGQRLLALGAESGVLAAQENLRAGGTHRHPASHRQRLAALLGEG